MNEHKIKPFVKWAGGKTQLLPIITTMIPKKYNKYIEPFVGGGALFFYLQAKKAIINDINNDLMTTYKVVKDDLANFLLSLNKIQENHINTDDKKSFHNSIRINENNVERERERERERDSINQATRFIYLNKTSFNGLYRVNSSGKFNVPYNNKDDLALSTLYDKNNLEQISHYLNNADVQIYNEDFEKIIDLAQADDFLFVDPPYDSDTQVFTAYDKEKFLKESQKRLASSLKKADQRGTKWILTNHDTLLIRELYKDFNFKKTVVNRQINSQASKRVQATDEVIIYNYSLDSEQENESNLEIFFKQLTPTSVQINDYVSWDNISQNTAKIKISCVTLNYLLTADVESFEIKFKDLWEENKKVFEILPILISKRLKRNETFDYMTNDKTQTSFDSNNFESTNIFINQSGLVKNLFLNPEVKDIYSYLFGVEVGMNTSNSQKNKTGLWMEAQVANLLIKYNINFKAQVNVKFLGDNNKKGKIFDYVLLINGFEYYLECNFFNASGSKINAECGRFIKLNDEFNKYNDKFFVWVTDGRGLIKNHNNVEEAFKHVKHFYNLYTFEKFIISLIKQQL